MTYFRRQIQRIAFVLGKNVEVKRFQRKSEEEKRTFFFHPRGFVALPIFARIRTTNGRETHLNHHVPSIDLCRRRKSNCRLVAAFHYFVMPPIAFGGRIEIIQFVKRRNAGEFSIDGHEIRLVDVREDLR